MVSGNFFKYFGQLFRPPFPLFFSLAYSQKKNELHSGRAAECGNLFCRDIDREADLYRCSHIFFGIDDQFAIMDPHNVSGQR